MSTVGQGSVSSDPPGISCGADCSESYDTPTTVTLTATASSGWTFTGWSGGCAGTESTCTVLVDSPINATATFTAIHALTVTLLGSGSGVVTSDPLGINCGSSCSRTYLDGTPVTLTATAAAGMTFMSWSGACSGIAETCSLLMDGPKDVGATFSIPGELVDARLFGDAAGGQSGRRHR